jgi:8-oxo-dGTP pyrophosphatase MutT (NUDIX family)
VYTDENGEYRYLIVKQSQTHWSFPKGHAEAGESPMDAARRELQEETGITHVRLKKRPRFSITYYFKRGNETVKKSVDHFLGFVSDTRVAPQEDEVMIIDWKWATYSEARELLYQNTAERILDRVARFLRKRNRKHKRRRRSR